MLYKKTNWFWKFGYIAINTMIILGITGCSDDTVRETQVTEMESKAQIPTQSDMKVAEEVKEICFDFYAKAAEENTWNDLEMIRSIINQLGENGYAAVDSDNQINMTCMDQVVGFCEKVDEKKEDKLILIEVTYFGGFVIYDLQTKDGNVNVTSSYYVYEDEKIEKVDMESYSASDWKYTADGYLMFSSTLFSEELYVLTLSEAEEHMAFRVLPLDETCRELNRKYLLPIGYEQNNMFLVDWSEHDFGELNFYDIYDIFYRLMNAQFVPYVADDNLEASAVYQIQKDEFEKVIMSYFKIDSEILQTKTVFYSEENAYEYRPRGFYEVEYPYSEVVAFVENNDGTITLTVHVVFPYRGISKVYAHEVVVRPLKDGGVQYVSNHMIPSEDNYKITWHTDRLTKEKWEKISL